MGVLEGLAKRRYNSHGKAKAPHNISLTIL